MLTVTQSRLLKAARTYVLDFAGSSVDADIILGLALVIHLAFDHEHGGALP